MIADDVIATLIEPDSGVVRMYAFVASKVHQPALGRLGAEHDVMVRPERVPPSAWQFLKHAAAEFTVTSILGLIRRPPEAAASVRSTL
jgi:hypothetical protein